MQLKQPFRVSRVHTHRMFEETKHLYFEHLEKALSVPESNNGVYCRKVEELICDFYGLPFANLTTSGTIALTQLALVKGVKPGDEIIATGYTCSNAIMAYSVLGASIKFCDINMHGVIDPDLIKPLIGPKTKYIAATGMFGNPVDWDTIKKIAIDNDLIILSDIAQSQNTDYKGTPVSQLDDMSMINFGRQKEIPVYGTYAAIVYKSDKYKDALDAARLCGMSRRTLYGRNKISHLGVNGEPSEDKAVACYISMLNAHKWLERRRQTAALYEDLFMKYGIKTLDKPDYTSSSSYQKFIVFVKDRKKVYDLMLKEGIPVYDHYSENLATSPILSSDNSAQFPTIDHFMSHTLSLPIDSWITSEEVSLIAETLDKVLDQNEQYYAV
jgi:dTDP-4-amino-4,6-dideoxygalactose transaminase